MSVTQRSEARCKDWECLLLLPCVVRGVCVCVCDSAVGEQRCRLLFHWSPGQSGSGDWGRRRCAQKQAPAHPPRSDCDLGRTEARLEWKNISALSSMCIFSGICFQTPLPFSYLKTNVFSVYSECQYWISVLFLRAKSERTGGRPARKDEPQTQQNKHWQRAGVRLMFKKWKKRNVAAECLEQIQSALTGKVPPG